MTENSKVAYDEILSGAFGSLIVQQTLDLAKAAVASVDIATMIRALKICQGCK